MNSKYKANEFFGETISSYFDLFGDPISEVKNQLLSLIKLGILKGVLEDNKNESIRNFQQIGQKYIDGKVTELFFGIFPIMKKNFFDSINHSKTQYSIKAFIFSALDLDLFFDTFTKQKDISKQEKRKAFILDAIIGKLKTFRNKMKRKLKTKKPINDQTVNIEAIKSVYQSVCQLYILVAQAFFTVNAKELKKKQEEINGCNGDPKKESVFNYLEEEKNIVPQFPDLQTTKEEEENEKQSKVVNGNGNKVTVAIENKKKENSKHKEKEDEFLISFQNEAMKQSSFFPTKNENENENEPKIVQAKNDNVIPDISNGLHDNEFFEALKEANKELGKADLSVFFGTNTKINEEKKKKIEETKEKSSKNLFFNSQIKLQENIIHDQSITENNSIDNFMGIGIAQIPHQRSKSRFFIDEKTTEKVTKTQSTKLEDNQNLDDFVNSLNLNNFKEEEKYSNNNNKSQNTVMHNHNHNHNHEMILDYIIKFLQDQDGTSDLRFLENSVSKMLEIDISIVQMLIEKHTEVFRIMQTGSSSSIVQLNRKKMKFAHSTNPNVFIGSHFRFSSQIDKFEHEHHPNSPQKKEKKSRMQPIILKRNHKPDIRIDAIYEYLNKYKGPIPLLELQKYLSNDFPYKNKGRRSRNVDVLSLILENDIGSYFIEFDDTYDDWVVSFKEPKGKIQAITSFETVVLLKKYLIEGGEGCHISFLCIFLYNHCVPVDPIYLETFILNNNNHFYIDSGFVFLQTNQSSSNHSSNINQNKIGTVHPQRQQQQTINERIMINNINASPMFPRHESVRRHIHHGTSRTVSNSDLKLGIDEEDGFLDNDHRFHVDVLEDNNRNLEKILKENEVVGEIDIIDSEEEEADEERTNNDDDEDNEGEINSEISKEEILHDQKIHSKASKRSNNTKFITILNYLTKKEKEKGSQRSGMYVSLHEIEKFLYDNGFPMENSTEEFLAMYPNYFDVREANGKIFVCLSEVNPFI